MSETSSERRPRARFGRAAAWATWSMAWALAGVALLLAWFGELPPEPLSGVFLSEAAPQIRVRADDIDITVALIYGPVAALILSRRPHPVGLLLALHAIGSGVAAFGLAWGLLGTERPDLPLWGLLAHAGGWAFVPGTFMLAALPFLVTHDRVPSAHRVLVLCCSVLAVVAAAICMTHQGPGAPDNPLAIDHSGYQASLPTLYTTLSLGALGISAISCVHLVRRARRSGGAGFAWLAAGQVLLTASYLVQAIPQDAGLPAWVLEFGLSTPVLGQILYPAAIVVVILGQRLRGVDVTVSRVLLWALLSFIGVIVYLLVVAAAPIGSAGAAASWVVPLAVATAVLPARERLQRSIDRLIYGEAADPDRLLRQMGERIGELSPGPEGLDQLATALRSVLRLGWVELQSGQLRAEDGRRTGGVVASVPILAAAGREIGTLRVQAPVGTELDRRTRVAVADLAGLVGTTIELIESYLVLDGARRELVARRADERRTLRRELHDGLGPALAGVGFALAAVENLVAREPAGARALLAELADDVQRHARGVRDLADAVLDGEGATPVVDDLHRLASRFRGHGRRVDVELTGAEILPARLHDTVYFVAAEALTNAARHSGARTIAIRLRIAGRAVELTVEDDGIGMAADQRRGIGLTSMHERTTAVGGVLDVLSGDGGTTIRMTAPVPSEPRAAVLGSTGG